MVVFDRPAGPRTSYKAWAGDQVVPAVIIEVVSRSDTDAEYVRKLGLARANGGRRPGVRPRRAPRRKAPCHRHRPRGLMPPALRR